MQLPISPLFLLPYTAVSRISFAYRRVAMVKSSSKYDLMMTAETVMGYKDGGKIPEDAVLKEDVGSAKKGGDMPKEEGNMCGWGKAP